MTRLELNSLAVGDRVRVLSQHGDIPVGGEARLVKVYKHEYATVFAHLAQLGASDVETWSADDLERKAEVIR